MHDNGLYTPTTYRCLWRILLLLKYNKLLQNSISELNAAFNPFRTFCKKKRQFKNDDENISYCDIHFE